MGCNKESIEHIKDHSDLIPSDYESSFYDMLSTLNEKTLHQQCINVLLAKAFKYLNVLSPELMNEVLLLAPKPLQLMQSKFLTRVIHVTNFCLFLL